MKFYLCLCVRAVFVQHMVWWSVVAWLHETIECLGKQLLGIDFDARLFVDHFNGGW